jgi:hypothetical protein
MDKVTVLKRLLRAVQVAAVTIKCLYADTAFCSIPVLRYLSYRAVPTIIAMPIRGKQAGTRALCQGRTSYRTSYTLQSMDNGRLRVQSRLCGRCSADDQGSGRCAGWCMCACVYAL